MGRDVMLTRLRGEAGLTLLEAVIAVGILTVVAGLFSTATFQVLAAQRTWQPNAEAVRDLRSAGSIVAGDILNSATTTLAHNATAVTSTTFAWTDVSDNAFEVSYTLDPDDSTLKRTINGVTSEIADNVATAEFSRSGRLVTLYLEVSAAGGVNKSRTLHTYMRSFDDGT